MNSNDPRITPEMIPWLRRVARVDFRSVDESLRRRHASTVVRLPLSLRGLRRLLNRFGELLAHGDK